MGALPIRWQSCIHRLDAALRAVPHHGPCYLYPSLCELLTCRSWIDSDNNFVQLPTPYFAVLMFAHVVDHFFLSNRRLSENTKWIIFSAMAFAIVANFWWFRGLAFGIDGPIKEHTGLLWRKVSVTPTLKRAVLTIL